MPVVRRLVALALSVGVLISGFAIATGPAFAQDPPNQQKAKGQAKPAAKKRPVRRRPRAEARIGVMVPYPFPPALIIRHTPEAHDEIGALLFMLRYY